MKRIKVLIVDDSSVIRNIVKEILSLDPELDVVGEAKDPFVARELIKELNPDVITLDVEMPKMDGITFLRNLMRLRPMPVVMLSTLTTQGADITLQALELGAFDFIAKPSFESLVENRNLFAGELINKVKSAVTVDRKNYELINSLKADTCQKTIAYTGTARANHIVAIGASTGGTEAIREVVTRMPNNAPPIVVTQHIPETFSERFANRLNACCAVTVQEAQHGQKIKEGNVYIAPGSKHLKVVAKSGSLFCTLDDGPAVNRHRPSVDVLFESLMEVADNVQAILLTGMGQDGARGMKGLKNAGAFTIVQDQASSLIWGMPGSAHDIQAHCVISPLNDIAKIALAHAQNDRQAMKKVVTTYV